MSEHTHTEPNPTGPIRTGRQFFWWAFMSFAIPFFVIVALVIWVDSGAKTSPGQTNAAEKIEAKLQPVSRVAVRGEDDGAEEVASAPAQPVPEQVAAADSGADTGKALYDRSCAACHAAGVAGAPKYGDADAWGPGIAEGMDYLMNIAVNGQGAMPPRGASGASDEELRAAVEYMVAAAGGDAAPASAEAPEAQEQPAEEAAEADSADQADESAQEEAAAEEADQPAVDLAAGKALYDRSCVACHGAGVAGAPKLGDKDAWAAGIAEGMDFLMDIAINGKGAMPPRGASGASDEELHAAVQYMVNAAQ